MSTRILNIGRRTVRRVGNHASDNSPRTTRTAPTFCLAAFLVLSATAYGQSLESSQPPGSVTAFEPCQTDSTGLFEVLAKLGPGFGYPVDSLRKDLLRWRSSPYVRVDSVGASVQNRALWRITISNDPSHSTARPHIAMHARTHPMEVESSYLVRALIDQLISEDPAAAALRAACRFSIVPMYNPDGVELGYSRENANRVDLERGWETSTPEPEVRVLKALYQSFMQSISPVRVALNLHSSSGQGVRYFVYHHENGTSPEYASAEKAFIGHTRSFWPEGIGPWDTFVSWTGGTPPYYMESWFWLNFGEEVMALTYEEIYGNADLPSYHKSSDALLHGIAAFLEIDLPVSVAAASAGAVSPAGFTLQSVYPHPISSAAAVHAVFTIHRRCSAAISIYDMLGREVGKVASGQFEAGTYQFPLETGALAPGSYRLVMYDHHSIQSLPLQVLR